MTALGVIHDREPHQKGRCMARKSGWQSDGSRRRVHRHGELDHTR
jgi:hypothetical protein